MMIGVDCHPSFQQFAFFVEVTGEYSERRLNHSDGGPRNTICSCEVSGCEWGWRRVFRESGT
jgi:hypothetical protein